MDATDTIYLGASLAAVAASVFCLSGLVGKGPRGTVLIVVAFLAAWSFALPKIMFDVDLGGVPREIDLLSTVLRLAAMAGGVFAVWDFTNSSARENQPIAQWLLKQPLVWGGIACGVFYLLIMAGTIENSLLFRYFASHPILEITTVLFFIAAASLVMRCGALLEEQRTIRQVALSPFPAGGQSTEECDSLLAQLDRLPEGLQRSYLVRRLREAMQFVRRKESSDGLDDYLRHLEELDLASMNAAYATIRIIIWAIPILGFLGTVVGITMAIANMSPESLEQSMPEVIAGLGVAFDTTALALALVMALMFGKALVEKIEERLLSTVDMRVSDELVGRFESQGAASDPNVVTIRRMSEQVLAAVEKMASRQAQVWKVAFDESQHHWAEIASNAGLTVRDALATTINNSLNHHADRLERSAREHSDALADSTQESVGHLRDGLEKLGELLVESLHQHGEVLTASERELAQENRRHLSEVEAALGEAMVVAADRQEQLIKQSEHLLTEMQVALIEAAGATVEHQEQLVRQSDVLLRVVDATGQIKELETSLNENLAAIRRSASLDQLVQQLTAAMEAIGPTQSSGSAPHQAEQNEQARIAPHAA